MAKGNYDEKSQFQKMKQDQRTLHRRNYLIKKNGGIKGQRRFLELTPYTFMLEKQKGVCAICGMVEKNGRALSIDHKHGTETVRGLLCGNCNRGLGLFRDSSGLLLVAAKYLKKYE